ncbi:hypothetical protein niasHT_018856 [Heterodera trifolii]|uniref:ZP domain-containing protein n=1 Tax=Heterodera trifolii TaxID=157864 RepID=A0ABD2KXM2_9BILA
MDSAQNARGEMLDSDVILSEKFNAPKFITDFLRNVQSGEEARSLQNLRQTLAARSNSTAETIKDVVFDHYKQFIDTSKEISTSYLSNMVNRKRSTAQKKNWRENKFWTLIKTCKTTGRDNIAVTCGHECAHCIIEWLYTINKVIKCTIKAKKDEYIGCVFSDGGPPRRSTKQLKLLLIMKCAGKAAETKLVGRSIGHLSDKRDWQGIAETLLVNSNEWKRRPPASRSTKHKKNEKQKLSNWAVSEATRLLQKHWNKYIELCVLLMEKENRTIYPSEIRNPLSTSVVERQFALPQCNYHLRHGIDGPFLKYASIGEPVTHVWQCDPVAGWLYGVLIHSCFVDDGRGNRFDLVDDKGCVTDQSLLADIQYDEKAFAAHSHAHVFRYADRVQLFFTCTVQLCFREDGGCEGISPPQCDRHNTSPAQRPKEHSQHFSRLPLPRPPGLNRNFRKSSESDELPLGPPPSLGRRPPLSARPSPPPSPGGPFHPPLFGRGEPPYKDSPLLANANGTGASDERLADQLLLFEVLSETNRSRAGRDAQIEEEDDAFGAVMGRMETDLSADLTVVPKPREGEDAEGPQMGESRGNGEGMARMEHGRGGTTGKRGTKR